MQGRSSDKGIYIVSHRERGGSSPATVRAGEELRQGYIYSKSQREGGVITCDGACRGGFAFSGPDVVQCSLQQRHACGQQHARRVMSV